MSKRIQVVVIGVIATVLLFGSVAAAASRTESISVIFRDIKIVIDGEEFIPEDINGNTVEPFIHNGTTYLPVRAVGQALDREVTWDSNANTVHIDRKSPGGGGSVPPASGVLSVVITYTGRPVADVTMNVDERAMFGVRVEPVGAEDEIIWVSSDLNIFEVVVANQNGTEAEITAIGRGTATLTVLAGGKETNCIVRVR